jgi:peptidoglycan hydrolase-like protein with peptidoglycan-binding domain
MPPQLRSCDPNLIMLQSFIFQAEPRLEAAAQNAPPLARPDTGEAVQVLQVVLASLGCALPNSKRANNIFDGIFGQETDSAVRQFQADNGLTVDGVVGRFTMAALDQVLASTGSDPLLQATADVLQAGGDLALDRIAGDGIDPVLRRIFDQNVAQLGSILGGNISRSDYHKLLNYFLANV